MTKQNGNQPCRSNSKEKKLPYIEVSDHLPLKKNTTSQKCTGAHSELIQTVSPSFPNPTHLLWGAKTGNHIHRHKQHLNVIFKMSLYLWCSTASGHCASGSGPSGSWLHCFPPQQIRLSWRQVAQACLSAMLADPSPESRCIPER